MEPKQTEARLAGLAVSSGEKAGADLLGLSCWWDWLQEEASLRDMGEPGSHTPRWSPVESLWECGGVSVSVGQTLSFETTELPGSRCHSGFQ